MAVLPFASPRNFVAVISVTDKPFSSARRISGCGEDEAEALVHCKAAAQSQGWTPPRWWQAWRWSDSRAPVVLPMS
ncbi:hypothetical protein LC612_38990 [Nostoc sp. CHAB 5834]|nr:hypothetical protein [Nostoc sp. CHAB 5834]